MPSIGSGRCSCSVLSPSLWRGSTIAVPSSMPSPNAEALRRTTWEEVRAHYATLADRPLTPATAPAWLRDWSALECALTEAAAVAMAEYTCDTENAEKRELYQRFSGDILPRAEELSVGLAKRLVAFGWTPPGMELPV